MTTDAISRQVKQGSELVVEKSGLTAHSFAAFKFPALYTKHSGDLAKFVTFTKLSYIKPTVAPIS